MTNLWVGSSSAEWKFPRERPIEILKYWTLVSQWSKELWQRLFGKEEQLTEKKKKLMNLMGLAENRKIPRNFESLWGLGIERIQLLVYTNNYNNYFTVSAIKHIVWQFDLYAANSKQLFFLCFSFLNYFWNKALFIIYFFFKNVIYHLTLEFYKFFFYCFGT